MSYTVDIKCPKCKDLLCCEITSSFRILSIKRVSFRALCTCGYAKKYRLISADKYNELTAEGGRVKAETYPDLLEKVSSAIEACDSFAIDAEENEKGFVICPRCGFKFKKDSDYHYKNGVHKRCGQKVNVVQRSV